MYNSSDYALYFYIQPSNCLQEAALTPEIIITLSILLIAIVLLIWERLRVDLVALLVLVTLALSGMLSPEEALSGFSNPAVVTVWAIFILSGALAKTGVANRVGKLILRLGGNSQTRFIAIIMLIGGGLSAFMNNVGVAALLLPVVTHIARKTGFSLSKLLIPLAFGTLLGGMQTLIGTPPNILVSDIMADFNLPSFNFFDFIYVGFPLLIIGVLYMTLIGHRLLPDNDKTGNLKFVGVGSHFQLSERFFTLTIPEGSPLAEQSLAKSRIGAALKLSVIGIKKGGQINLAPEPEKILRSGDELIVLGRPDWLKELSNSQNINLSPASDDNFNQNPLNTLISKKVSVIEAKVPENSALVGRSILELNFRQSYHANVLAIGRGEQIIRTALQHMVLRENDRILLHVERNKIPSLTVDNLLEIEDVDAIQIYQLEERLIEISIPKNSSLLSKSLSESKLANAFGLSVLAITRNKENILMPLSTMKLQADDRLIVEGKQEDVNLLRAIQDLKIGDFELTSLDQLESDDVGLVEVVLSPRSNLNEKSLQEINFREKFGLSILAIWRAGVSRRSNLREFPLKFGDSLLIFGNRNRIRMLAKEKDFLVLGDELQEAPRHEKARTAIIIMGAVVLTAGLGLLPIAIAAVTGATLMVVTQCIDMEEAYTSIHWQAIFLIAGMLPLGIALQNSGSAQFLAEQVISLTIPYGPQALMGGILILAMLGAQVMPNSVVAVLIAPIALNAAANLGYSPQALAMIVAVGASASFMSPVGHPANVLVMGPGSYRFKDFIKVGFPLSLLIIAATLFILPKFWPLIP